VDDDGDGDEHTEVVPIDRGDRTVEAKNQRNEVRGDRDRRIDDDEGKVATQTGDDPIRQPIRVLVLSVNVQ
jgi:hypothetical protein